MAKLYRIVPDTISTIMETGYLTKVSEDLFYKSKYIEVPAEGYFGIYQEGKGMRDEVSTDSMFFFVSPWSCIRALEFLKGMRGTYSDKVARIFEYEIPDEIINVSDDVFTNYEQWQAKGKMIPLALLQKGKEVCAILDDKLKEELEKNSLYNASETITILKQNYCDKFKFDAIEQSLVERMKRINNFKFKEKKCFFESDYITEKTMVVTDIDCETILDVMFQECSEDALNEIIAKSNGMLTPENLADYDFDTPGHKYGIIH